MANRISEVVLELELDADGPTEEVSPVLLVFSVFSSGFVVPSAAVFGRDVEESVNDASFASEADAASGCVDMTYILQKFG